jgi:hypothetical protein
MAFADDVALASARLSAYNPGLALNTNSVLMSLVQAILSANNDTASLVTAASQQQFLSTAVGSALDARAADYGISRYQGAPATATVVFKMLSGTASSTITIASGTLVSTAQAGTSTPITFATQATATINSGASVGNAVTVQAQTNGVATNVSAGSITVVNNPPQNVGVSNAVADGGTAATGGLDPWSDAQLRAAALANLATKYGALSIQSAILAVTGVYDAVVTDPQNGNSTVTYAVCDANGAQAAFSQSAVQTAVTAVLPPNTIISPAASNFQSVVLLTSIPITYSAPSSLQSSVIEPLIKQAVINYIQGTNFSAPSAVAPTAINVQSGLIHGQALTQFGLAAYVQSACGGVLTNFVLGGTTPPSSAVGSQTVYRAPAGPSIVQLTRQ